MQHPQDSPSSMFLGLDLEAIGQLLMSPDPAVPVRRADLIEAFMLVHLDSFRQVIEADPYHLWGVPLPTLPATLRVFKPWHVNPLAWAMLELTQEIWLLALTPDLLPVGRPYVDAVYNEHWREVQALRERWHALDFEWSGPLKEAARSIYGTAAQRQRFAELSEQRDQAWLAVGRVSRAYRLPILDALGIRWAGGEWKVGWW